MVSATKDPLKFNDLMATPIYFSNIELEYNIQECFNALTDRLDWNNQEGDCYPFDLFQPLPLQGHPCHLTVAADYFFNNDLEYLKSSDPERTYTTSIKKTKASWYEIVGIEDMVPTLWSPTKVRTLKEVRDELYHSVLDFHLGYNTEMSKRKWTAIDKKRSELMVELIE
ncbi:hypothetical protein Tco_1324839 [Tanacetum coccineum]